MRAAGRRKTCFSNYTSWDCRQTRTCMHGNIHMQSKRMTESRGWQREEREQEREKRERVRKRKAFIIY